MQGKAPIGLFWKHLSEVVDTPLYQILFWIIILDWISGACIAWKRKEFSSSLGISGMAKHLFVLVITLLTLHYSRMLAVEKFGEIWLFGMLAHYIWSLIENWERLGLPFPEQLKPYINNFKKQQLKSTKSSEEIVAKVASNEEKISELIELMKNQVDGKGDE